MLSATPSEVRSHLIEALQLDLIGPTPDDIDHAEEILDQAPSKWYLTGFLVPHGAPIEQRGDDTADDDLDQLQRGSAGEDETVPDKPFAKKAFFPSSMGLSFLVAENASQLNLTVQWGDYFPIKDNSVAESQNDSGEEKILLPLEIETTIPQEESNNSLLGCWKRIPRQAKITIPLMGDRNPEQLELGLGLSSPKQLKLPLHQSQSTKTIPIADSNGLQLVVSIRPVTSKELVPAGTRSVSVFLVNNRLSTSDKQRDISYIFQASLIIHTPEALVPRPNLRGRDNNDWDENVADLQYRDDYEYAVGHNVSAIALTNPDGSCQEVCTAWIPTADVEKVIATQVKDVELGMEALADAPTPEALQNMLSPMVDAYADWIKEQRTKCPSELKRLNMAISLLNNAEIANKRIDAGIKALSDPQIFEAFQIGNRAIATYVRQRATHGKNITPESLAPPEWRPFQLAFILMNLAGIAYPENSDRELVDLLFFPTGGGKTEAYLGLAAFTLVLRRLRYPGIKSAGLSVLMRYTLRLLTLDQLGRAATMICALELERQKNPQKLGTWPFEIGLWVGQTATPNRMGKKGDNDDNSARKRTLDFQNNNRNNPSPIPLEKCPWCDAEFQRNSFQLLPNTDQPTNLRVFCANRHCHFRGDNPLPIVAVDEPIYRRLPCFIISTVDKFASLPWVGETGALFGRVDRYDNDGFYGPTQPGRGKPLGGYLPPPDLIIQDELHLISGPLGTMVGLYETAIDALCSQEIDGKKIRPKIVASTGDKKIKQVEIETLLASSVEVGEDVPEGDFYARSRQLNNLKPTFSSRIERIVLVDRLREVIAQVGFTRFEAEMPDIDGELDISVRRAALDIETTWVPAIENRGEGVFIAFRKEAIEDWLKREAVKKRGRELSRGFDIWCARKGIDQEKEKIKFPGLPYIMLHSLSHLLIVAVSLECGYAASSIRERIYAGDTGYGILLYTGSSGSEGTLGGLVEVGKRIEYHLEVAIEQGRLCSNDPVCAQHRPDDEQEERFLHGSACHGCLLIAETSCERRNEFLDRALVVSTVEGLGAEFFPE
ncbi:DrmB family protein [Nostoc sp.]|uniref:DrmB family protein n=1 Tax=Nostoc sp. TaxID=1180 RepID=UPI002FF6B308